MSRTFRLIAVLGSSALLLSFGVLVVNQTAQVVQLASTIHPKLGTATLCTLLLTYLGLIGVPLVLIIRLPSPLTPPASKTGPEFDEHLQRLSERLAASPHLKGRELKTEQDVEEALAILAKKSDEIVRQTATSIFLATAVSQSGRLDGLLVFAAQSRMVWRLALLHYQRPSVRDMINLYANVAGTAFVASEIEDININEHVEPVIGAAVSALGAGVPGLQVAGAILAKCVLDGSANAFLTLRVGFIAKQYCEALVVVPKKKIRSAASAEAARLLGVIVADGTRRISKAVWDTGVGKVGGALSDASNRAASAGARLLAKVRGPRFEPPEVG